VPVRRGDFSAYERAGTGAATSPLRRFPSLGQRPNTRRSPAALQRASVLWFAMGWRHAQLRSRIRSSSQPMTPKTLSSTQPATFVRGSSPGCRSRAGRSTMRAWTAAASRRTRLAPPQRLRTGGSQTPARVVWGQRQHGGKPIWTL